MNKNDVINAVDKCVRDLYKKDKYLFDCEICERCLMFRLAYYLQLKFPDYFVDCEFNKMGFRKYKADTKVELVNGEKKLKKMYTDIIIHKRNSNIKDNFICIEVKRRRNKKGMKNDIKRLKMMTSKNGFIFKNTNYIYAYNFGFTIYLPKDETNFKVGIFENGKNNLTKRSKIN